MLNSINLGYDFDRFHPIIAAASKQKPESNIEFKAIDEALRLFDRQNNRFIEEANATNKEKIEGEELKALMGETQPGTDEAQA